MDKCPLNEKELVEAIGRLYAETICLKLEIDELNESANYWASEYRKALEKLSNSKETSGHDTV